jgi:hypothetical protein
MSYRIHTTDSPHVIVRYVDHPATYFENADIAVGPALVLDDGDNQEAFVIVGSPDMIATFARRILAELPVALTESEQAFLTHICDEREYDVNAGSLLRAKDGWACFTSDEDTTSFDLTNEQERALAYDSY